MAWWYSLETIQWLSFFSQWGTAVLGVAVLVFATRQSTLEGEGKAAQEEQQRILDDERIKRQQQLEADLSEAKTKLMATTTLAANTEKRTADRRLSVEQIQALTKSLVDHAPGDVAIELDPSVSDGEAFAESIRMAIESAGIRVVAVNHYSIIGPRQTGVFVGVFEGDKTLARQILAAFAAAGVDAGESRGDHRMRKGTVIIQIGHKPR